MPKSSINTCSYNGGLSFDTSVRNQFILVLRPDSLWTENRPPPARCARMDSGDELRWCGQKRRLLATKGRRRLLGPLALSLLIARTTAQKPRYRARGPDGWSTRGAVKRDEKAAQSCSGRGETRREAAQRCRPTILYSPSFCCSRTRANCSLRIRTTASSWLLPISMPLGSEPKRLR